MAASRWITADAASVSTMDGNVLRHFTSPAKMDEMRTLEVLDLSNSDLVGAAAVASALKFITCAPTDCKLPLTSIDLSHNRLGDEGALALAQIVHDNTTKLRCLVAVNLFENGIRDRGAEALMRVFKKHATSTLPVLESIELHDNDISEAVLSAIDEVWKKINRDRPPEWKRKDRVSPMPFGKLLMVQMKKLQEDVKREKERIAEAKQREAARVAEEKRLEAELIAKEKERLKEACIESTATALEPLTMFLKGALWDFVSAQRKELVHPAILHVFRLPTENEETSICTVDPFAFLEEIVGKERRALLAQVPRLLLDKSDSYGLIFPLETRNDADASTVTDLMTQLESFHALLEAAHVDADTRLREGSGEEGLGLATLSQALTRGLGLGVNITRSNAYVEYIDFYYTPFVTYSDTASSQNVFLTAPGFSADHRDCS